MKKIVSIFYESEFLGLSEEKILTEAIRCYDIMKAAA